MTKSADPGGANGEAGVKKGKIAFASVDSLVETKCALKVSPAPPKPPKQPRGARGGARGGGAPGAIAGSCPGGSCGQVGAGANFPTQPQLFSPHTPLFSAPWTLGFGGTVCCVVLCVFFFSILFDFFFFFKKCLLNIL